jgi:broad specificity phosphatase PhoE
LFVRHGARYPNPKQVNASKKFLEESYSHLEKSSSFSLLKNIVLTFLNKPAYGLSDLGKKEIFDMAQRYRDRYPLLFQNLEEKKMSVISSVKDRCIDSAREFLKPTKTKVPASFKIVTFSPFLNSMLNILVLIVYSQCLKMYYI